MLTMKAPTISALQAQAAANLYLLERVPDRLTADQPRFDEAAQVWRVPVILTYQTFGTLGQVGEIVVATSEQIVSATPAAEMLAAAQVLVEPYRDAIEAAVP